MFTLAFFRRFRHADTPCISRHDAADASPFITPFLMLSDACQLSPCLGCCAVEGCPPS